MILLKGIAIWLMFIVAETVNGIVRNGLVLMALSPLLAVKIRGILAVRDRTANEN